MVRQVFNPRLELTIDIGGAKKPGMMIIPIQQGAKEPREPPKPLVSESLNPAIGGFGFGVLALIRV